MSDVTQRRKMQRMVIVPIILVGFWLIFSSSGSKGTPEEQIRQVVNELLEGAEKHDIAPFEKYLSDQLEDQDGLGKTEVLQRLRLLYMRHPSIHLEILVLDIMGTSELVRNVELQLLMSTTHIPQDKGAYEFVFRYEDETWKMYSLKWGQGYGLD